MKKTISQKIDDLITCLCAQIIEDGNGNVCFCGIMPGSEVAMDYFGECTDACGMAYVTLETGTPANGIGVENTQVNNCGSAFTFDVEIGILRCVEAGDEHGAPPTPESLNETAHVQFADILTMRRAVQCCNPKPYILGAYTPYGPTGGAVGGTFLLTLLEE